MPIYVSCQYRGDGVISGCLWPGNRLVQSVYPSILIPGCQFGRELPKTSGTESLTVGSFDVIVQLLKINTQRIVTNTL